MSSNNAGTFVQKILLSLLLLGCGVVIGRYTATGTEQSSASKAVVVNSSALPTAGQPNLIQQHKENAAHDTAPTKAVPLEKTEAVDGNPCVAPTIDTTPRIAEVEDRSKLVDRPDNGSDQAQTSSTTSDDHEATLESLAKTIQASGEKIKKDFEAQPRNYEWATEMENNIQEYFYYSQYSSGVFPEQIECKETICNIIYLAKVESLCDVVTSEIAAQEWWKFSTFQHSRSQSEEKEDVTCTIFASLQ